MDDFLEFVKQRRAALRKELLELETAERIYKQSGAGPEGAFLPLQGGPTPIKPTIKEGILQLLGEVYPMGLTALEILDRLNRRWWQGDLQRTSLSPQISRLSQEKKVVSERGTWKLKDANSPAGLA